MNKHLSYHKPQTTNKQVTYRYIECFGSLPVFFLDNKSTTTTLQQLLTVQFEMKKNIPHERKRSRTETTQDDERVVSSQEVSVSSSVPVSVRGKPNSQLTEEEKIAKRRLKKRVKLQSRIKSIQNRIRHSQIRKDPEQEEIARKDLTALYEKEKEAIEEMNFGQEGGGNNYGDGDDDDENATQMRLLREEAKPLIFQVTDDLFRQADKVAIAQGETTKEVQTANAVKLLKHMTKGTQNLKMFEDKDALWGYARQKFHERAMLLCTSLGRIRLRAGSKVKNNDNDAILKRNLILKRAWDMIKAKCIRKVCSIGCGPGNDAVGLLSFLRMALGSSINILDDLLLVDWSINEWKNAIIDPLQNILEQNKFVGDESVHTIFGDVTKDLEDEENVNLLTQLCGVDGADHDHDVVSNYDMFLISYLLSETRGKWEKFFIPLVKIVKPGCMFYFAEPVPWQLHRFIERFNEYFDFVWIDSSMDYPALQEADRRAGPAVLFAIKK